MFSGQMKKIVCYFKISISYGNTGYIWYDINHDLYIVKFNIGRFDIIS